MRPKNRIEVSKCCRAKVKTVGMADFIGGAACTLHYECTKCSRACDIIMINIKQGKRR